MSAQHTPGPWYVEADGHTVKAMNSGMTIASTRQNVFHPKDRVDAEFIVRACNAHDDLVAALETCRRCFAADPLPLTASALEADRQAAGAIAKARRQS